MSADYCTRGVAAAFLAEPATPDTGCLSEREPIMFATSGLDELLTPKKP